MRDVLSMWVVYDRPRDYPEHFVARRWDVTLNQDGKAEMHATLLFELAATLEGIRDKLPWGLSRLERYAEDDPCIAEVWL